LAPATCNSKSSQRDCFMSMLQPAASSFQTNPLPCHPWQPPFTLTQVAPPTPSEIRHPCSLCASLLGSVLLRHKHALRTHRHKNITKYQHIHCEKVLEFFKYFLEVVSLIECWVNNALLYLLIILLDTFLGDLIFFGEIKAHLIKYISVYKWCCKKL